MRLFASLSLLLLMFATALFGEFSRTTISAPLMATFWQFVSAVCAVTIAALWVEWPPTLKRRIRQLIASLSLIAPLSGFGQSMCDVSEVQPSRWGDEIGVVCATNVIFRADQVLVFAIDSQGNPVRSLHVSILDSKALLGNDSVQVKHDVLISQSSKSTMDISAEGWKCHIDVQAGSATFDIDYMKEWDIAPPETPIRRLLWHTECQDAPEKGKVMTRWGEASYYESTEPGQLPLQMIYPTTLLFVRVGA